MARQLLSNSDLAVKKIEASKTILGRVDLRSSLRSKTKRHGCAWKNAHKTWIHISRMCNSVRRARRITCCSTTPLTRASCDKVCSNVDDLFLSPVEWVRSCTNMHKLLRLPLMNLYRQGPLNLDVPRIAKRPQLLNMLTHKLAKWSDTVTAQDLNTQRARQPHWLTHLVGDTDTEGDMTPLTQTWQGGEVCSQDHPCNHMSFSLAGCF
mmetsp:Transcript_136056/g.261306  ORF Transcript_136056/g.261306 Transcript_136056/m.261306 type:complete len:208 (+) Transcript_136056:736-1359(+)